MKLDRDNAGWMASVRNEWHRRLQPTSTHLGRHIFDVPKRFAQEAVSGGRLYADRVEALSYFPEGGKVGEIGTFAGWFAEKIIEEVRPETLHLYDLTFDLLRAERLNIAQHPKVTLHQGDSSSLLAQMPDRYFDWLYIDGGHDLESVQKDTAIAIQKIKQEGVLVFNDYTPWSILELEDYGVIPVVNEMLSTGGWKVVYLAFHPHMYCDLAVRRA